jgi:hypothetical protein
MRAVEEFDMQSRNAFSLAISMALLAGLTLNILLAAQEQSAEKERKAHPWFILVDLGTFGGPTSFLDCCAVQVAPVLNKRGTFVGGADTPASNPNYAIFNPLIGPDPYVDTGFKWQRGILTNLGTLPGGFNLTSTETDAQIRARFGRSRGFATSRQK